MKEGAIQEHAAELEATSRQVEQVAGSLVGLLVELGEIRSILDRLAGVEQDTTGSA